MIRNEMPACNRYVGQKWELDKASEKLHKYKLFTNSHRHAVLEKAGGKCGPHVHMRFRFMHIYNMLTLTYKTWYDTNETSRTNINMY